MGLIATVGNRTEIPYHIAEIDRNVYSVEELIYSLVQSARFIDEEILDPELVRWLDEECGLKDLSSKLSMILADTREEKNHVADFVLTILSVSDYATQEQRDETKRILRTGEGMQKFEMREARADYMMDSGHFAQAMTEYDHLLEELPEPERQMRARIEHSRGVIYANYYRFDMAAECFRTACRLREDNQYYIDYLAAVRMYLPDSDYVSFVSKHPEAYDASMKLETMMEDVRKQYDDAPGTKQIRHLRELLEQNADESFRAEMQATARELRANYRTNVAH